MTDTKVATKEEAGLPAPLDFGEDAGQGFDNQDSSFISIPFLNLLQAMSPQIDEEKYEAQSPKAGMFFNTVTEDFIAGKDGIEIVPADIQRVYVEWVPRDNGGGLVAVHDPNDPATKKLIAEGDGYGVIQLENGNELIETFYLYGITVEGESATGMIVVPFTSTKIKVLKGINTKLNTFAHRRFGMRGKPPMFSHRLRMTSSKEKNNKGDFYNYAVTSAVTAFEHDGKKGHSTVVDALFDAKVLKKGDVVPNVLASMISPGDERYEEAKNCLQMVRSGEAKADYESQSAAGSDAGSSGDNGEVPF